MLFLFIDGNKQSQVLHVETMDKRDVNLQSPNMEHQAFLHSMSYIKGKITCDELVTDASSSIRKSIGSYIYHT